MPMGFERATVGVAALVVAVAVVLWLRLQSVPIAVQPTSYWCTVVGVERNNSIAPFLEPLQGRWLVGIRQVSAEGEFVRRLSIELPPIIESALVAVYEQDPHLNWRKAHLLHQGPLGRELVNLVFPTLACGGKVNLNRILDTEDTLALLKPEVVKSTSKTAEIIDQITKEGFEIVVSKKVSLSASTIGQFYQEHVSKPFYHELKSHMESGPVQVMILRGPDAIARLRMLVGDSTDPSQAASHSLRSLYGTNRTANAIHASDSHVAARHEISLLCP